MGRSMHSAAADTERFVEVHRAAERKVAVHAVGLGPDAAVLVTMALSEAAMGDEAGRDLNLACALMAWPGDGLLQ